MLKLQPYDSFSEDYDKFVNWESRLNYELPFIENQLKSLGSDLKVLDAACGTGKHVIALAERGFEAVGADSSIGMVKKARENSTKAGATTRFEQAGFGGLAKTFGDHSFDAVLCLGNSLPHTRNTVEFTEALTDFADVLRPGGLVIIQNRNFDAVMRTQERWMEPQGYQEGSKQWLFLRFYDYLPDGTINFNIVTLQQVKGGPWQQSVTSTQLRPLFQEELVKAMLKAGFEVPNSYGDMSGAPFDPQSSGNLVLTATRKRS